MAENSNSERSASPSGSLVGSEDFASSSSCSTEALLRLCLQQTPPQRTIGGHSPPEVQATRAKPPRKQNATKEAYRPATTTTTRRVTAWMSTQPVRETVKPSASAASRAHTHSRLHTDPIVASGGKRPLAARDPPPHQESTPAPRGAGHCSVCNGSVVESQEIALSPQQTAAAWAVLEKIGRIF